MENRNPLGDEDSHIEKMMDLARFLDGDPEEDEEDCGMFYDNQKVVVKVYNKIPSFWNQEGNMNPYMGKTVTIMSINSQEKTVRIVEDGGRWVWRFEDLTPVENINNPNYLFKSHKKRRIR